MGEGIWTAFFAPKIPRGFQEFVQHFPHLSVSKKIRATNLLRAECSQGCPLHSLSIQKYLAILPPQAPRFTWRTPRGETKGLFFHRK